MLEEYVEKENFDSNDYDIIFDGGKRAVPLDVVASSLNLLYEDFLKIYEIDKRARLFYQQGLSVKKVELINRLEEQSSDGSYKATEYYLTNMLDLKKDSSVARSKKQAENNDKHPLEDQFPDLLNPLLDD